MSGFPLPGTAADAAIFGSAAPTSGTIIINMSNAGGQLSVGEIMLTSSATKNITISDGMSPAGTLQLNGGSFTGNILTNEGASTLALTSGTNPMTVGLNSFLNRVEIDGAGGITISCNISGYGQNLNKTGIGSGALTLSGTNTYDGATIIDRGTLALALNGSIASTYLIGISGGGTFDVSGHTGDVTLGDTQTLSGYNTSSTPGTINAGAASGLKMGSSSSLDLTYASGNPTLTVTGGALTFQSTNPAKVSTTSTLAAGDYTLISSGSGGSVAGSAPSAVNVVSYSDNSKSGICAGCTASLQIISGQLILRVVGGTTGAEVSAGGRVVTANGQGISGARITLTGTTSRAQFQTITSPFGYFKMDGLDSGETYVITASAKRFRFPDANRVITLNDSVDDILFTANP